MENFWIKQAELKSKEKLKEDRECEVLIVGAGIAGLLCAYRLMKSGKNVVVIEKNRIGQGITAKTTAKITYQMGLFYADLIKKVGLENSIELVKLYKTAINEYERIISEEKIDCSFKRIDSALYSKQNFFELENEAKAAERLNIDCCYKEKEMTPDGEAAVLTFFNQAQFSPLQFLSKLADQCVVYEHTPLLDVQDNKAVTPCGTISFQWIIFATHYPVINVPGFYFMKMHQERSHVLLLKNVPVENRMLYGIDEDGCSFRWEKDYLLMGKGNYRTGNNRKGDKTAGLREKAKQLFPDAIEVDSWSTQDCITLDGLPYVGAYAESRDNWLIMTGFNKWGMVHAMSCAIIIEQKLNQQTGPLHDLLNSTRTVLKEPAAFIKEAKEEIIGLIKTSFEVPDVKAIELPCGHGGIVWLHHSKWGVYREDENTFHLVQVQCPHLGCQLEWNPDDKSWDCPCHGSRFSYDGKVLNGPAEKRLNYHCLSLKNEH